MYVGKVTVHFPIFGDILGPGRKMVKGRELKFFLAFFRPKDNFLEGLFLEFRKNAFRPTLLYM